MNTRHTLIGKLILVTGLFLLSAPAVMAQPIDYCEGNFDNDYDVDGTDAFVFKTDFGRSSLSDPCPVIECQTAEELEMRIVQLETQLAQVTALLENVSRDIVQGHDTIRFTGMNVQIVDGSETTDDDVNGLGNLIVGYNELRGVGDDRTGSHNIVVGAFHNYSSYGGLVAGYGNNVSGGYSSVSGGSNNTASGGNSSVSGGVGNIASDNYSSISGGASNKASGYSASVTGGRYNEASGEYSFVGGGGYTSEADGNMAFGHYSAVLGGRSNLTGDPDLTDHTLAQSASVSGGTNNTASGNHASVSGGENNNASGPYSSVCGGFYNTASGGYASVSGGENNEADQAVASVSGGQNNTASGLWATVSGGQNNTASGMYSNVSGGNNRSVSGDHDWRAGSCYFCDN